MSCLNRHHPCQLRSTKILPPTQTNRGLRPADNIMHCNVNINNCNIDDPIIEDKLLGAYHQEAKSDRASLGLSAIMILDDIPVSKQDTFPSLSFPLPCAHFLPSINAYVFRSDTLRVSQSHNVPQFICRVVDIADTMDDANKWGGAMHPFIHQNPTNLQSCLLLVQICIKNDDTIISTSPSWWVFIPSQAFQPTWEIFYVARTG